VSFGNWDNKNKYSQAFGNSETNQLSVNLPKNIYSIYRGNRIGKAIRNIVHEFGHLFEDSVGFYEGTNQWNSSLAKDYSRYSAHFSRNDYGSPENDWWGFAGGQNDWQFSQPGEGFGQFIEVFADMFLGFTYNSWGTSDLANDRSNFMIETMTSYLEILK
jgi:hypothetical protein